MVAQLLFSCWVHPSVLSGHTVTPSTDFKSSVDFGMQRRSLGNPWEVSDELSLSLSVGHSFTSYRVPTVGVGNWAPSSENCSTSLL